MKNLGSGRNVLSVEAADGGKEPCGLLVDLALTYTDGTAEHIISDKTWKTSNQRPPDNWKNAEEVCPFGKGPWGRR